MDSSITAIIIIVVMMVLYITELLPIAATSLLACLAFAVFGIISFGDVFSGFGNDMVFLVVGMMVVGDALFETGVASYIGKRIVSLTGSNERALIAALIVVVIPISMFLSNTATVATMLPIAASAIAMSGGKLTKKNTYMTIAMVSVAGGGLTLVGSTPQLIAQGILTEGGYGSIGFFEFAIIGGPILALMVVYVLTLGYKLMKKVFVFHEVTDPIPDVAQTAQEEPADADYKLHKYTSIAIIRMCISVAVLVFCVIGFITGLWTTGIVAMVGAVICVVTGCISQNKVFQKMSWTSVVILGCSFGVAAGLEQSGAGRMIAHGMLALLGENLTPWLLCAVLALVACVLTNFMSSTATAALLVPIAALVAVELGYNVKTIVMAVAIAVNIGYATPISTPPLTMTLSAGYRFMDYVKVGGLMNVMAYLLTIALLPLIL